MTTWLVGNPAAGDGDRGVDFWLERLRDADLEVDETIDPGGLDGAAIERDDRVLAAGGDGTVQAVAGACARAGAVLAVLPSGTANDFARSLGLSGDPDEACRAVVDDRREVVDLGRIEATSGRRSFINVAHMGLGAEASRAVDDRDKKWFGAFSYARRLVERWREHRGTRGRLRCDDRVFGGRWLEIAVANGAFYGGGNRVPEAVVDDGAFEVYAVRADHPLRLAWTLVAVRLLGPERVRSPRVVHQRCRRVSLTAKKPMAATADGEDIGETPVEVELEAGALTVIRGPGTGAFEAAEQDPDEHESPPQPPSQKTSKEDAR
ncbi:diacylglycerol kinase family lipid kinase [Halomonas denitrificans]|nr:diacylglycerol kinase family lipid kinase [Halomonas denitrificans]